MKYVLAILLLLAVTASADTVVDTIGASADDGVKTGVNFSYTGTTIGIGKTLSVLNAGLRWTLNVAAGATIDSAFMSLKSSSNETGATVTLALKAEDTADAAAFSDATDFNARVKTTASVAWSPGSWSTGTRYKSPDIKTVIQEVTDRGDWTSGNDIVIFLSDNGSSTNADRAFYAQDNAEPDSVNAILTVYYTPSVTAPDANFGAAPLSGARNLSVTFTDSSTGTPTSWKYYFGDGDSASTQNPTHVYDSVGTYSVKLRACNVNGCDSLTRTDYISVTPMAKPTAIFYPDDGYDSVGDTTYLMNWRDSSLPASVAHTYDWDFGDGNDTSYQASSPVSVGHNYTVPGIYDVTLIVSNADSADTSLHENMMTIRHGWVDAAFTGSPVMGLAPCTVTFDNTSSGDTTGWRWDFGDFSTLADTSVAFEPTYIFEKDGVYTVRLIAVGPVTSDTLIRTNYISVYEIQSYVNALRHSPGGVGMRSAPGATTERHGP